MATAETRTRSDAAGPNAWGISDEVTQLREWGTGIAYPLPPNHRTSILGAAPDCRVRLWDPTGRISRKHAELGNVAVGKAILDPHVGGEASDEFADHRFDGRLAAEPLVKALLPRVRPRPDGRARPPQAPAASAAIKHTTRRLDL